MINFDPSDELRIEIGKVLDQSCLNISDEGKEDFCKLWGQFRELEHLDWIVRSCFMKGETITEDNVFMRDGKFTDDNVLMRVGDRWPEKSRGVIADYSPQKMFGLFSRSAMLNQMVIRVTDFIMGTHPDDSSLFNFAKKYCPEKTRNEIWAELKIKEGKSREPKPKCELEGFKELMAYRNKHAAHLSLKYDPDRNLKYSGEGPRPPKYATIEECIQRILQAMQVVYPDMDYWIDWRKRSGTLDRVRSPNEWTTDPDEPFIVQNLKELAIWRLKDRLARLQSLDPYGTNQSVQKKMDEICGKIEKIQAS